MILKMQPAVVDYPYQFVRKKKCMCSLTEEDWPLIEPAANTVQISIGSTKTGGKREEGGTNFRLSGYLCCCVQRGCSREQIFGEKWEQDGEAFLGGTEAAMKYDITSTDLKSVSLDSKPRLLGVGGGPKEKWASQKNSTVLL